jgi:hypothetical protein
LVANAKCRQSGHSSACSLGATAARSDRNRPERLIRRFPAAENAADGRDHATRASITAHLAIIDACR